MSLRGETNIPFSADRVRLLPAEWFALAAVGLSLAARFWVALSLGLDGDEAYYTMWSAYLQPGYLDHPPGVALMIALGRAIAGEGVLGVRLMSLLAAIVTLVALYRTARLLCDRTIAALAIPLYSLTLQAAVGFVATPDAPSTLCWVLAVWAAAEAVAGKRPGWWLAAGVFAGAGLVSKYTNAWLGIGLVLFLVASRDGRAQLRHWQLWIGGLLALVVFSPVLWWNWQHGWQSFLFQGARLTEGQGLTLGPLFAEYAVSQAVVMGPVLLLGALGAIVCWGLRFMRLPLPVLTSLPVLVYFTYHALHARVEANWTQPVLPMLALLAAAFICQLPKPWLRRSAVGLHAIIGLLFIGFAFIQGLFHPFELGIADRTRMLRGWQELATEIRSIANETGARAIWTYRSYQLTGELFFYGLVNGDTRPVRDLLPHPRYDYVPAADRFPPVSPALLVRRAKSPQEPPQSPKEFATSRLVRILTREDGSGVAEYYAVFAVSGPTDAFPRAD